MKREEVKGRGATLQIEGRFESRIRESCDDGWAQEELPPLKTTVTVEKAKGVILLDTSRFRPPSGQMDLF